MENTSKFAEFKTINRIWAIGSIHSNLHSFSSIKNHIIKNFNNNDKIVFLGNVIGLGDMSKETLFSILDMRNKLMSKFYLNPKDIIFLRGAQEEMLLKLLQLQTAPNPKEIIKWMFEHGVDKTVMSYGLDSKELYEVSDHGTLAIGKWTSNFNKIISSQLGHQEYFSNLHHAAFSSSKKILFVNRGVDVSRPLSAQNDCFWWGYQNFSKLDKPYSTFIKIVRGYEPSMHELNNKNDSNIVCSLYKGPLSNKKIVGGLFDDSGKTLDLFES